MDSKIVKEVGIEQEEESNINKGKVLRSEKEIRDEHRLEKEIVEEGSSEVTIEAEMEVEVEDVNKEIEGTIAMEEESGNGKIMLELQNQMSSEGNSDLLQAIMAFIQAERIAEKEERKLERAAERTERIAEKEEREKREELERKERIAEKEERRVKEALDREEKKAEKEERKQIIAQLQNMQRDMTIKEEEREIRGKKLRKGRKKKGE